MSISKQSRSGSAFVPSPQWLSESPARPPSSTASSNPLLLRRRTPRYSPGASGGRFEGGLVSPVPPPPANLFPEPQTPFNVDPGVPFLATEGDSQRAASESLREDGSSSQRDSERHVGGRLVSGIKNTVRRSLRRRHRHDYHEPEFIVDASDIYDSGYSSALASAPEAQGRQRPSTAEAVTSHEGVPKTGVIVYRPRADPVQQSEYPVHDRRRPRRRNTADVAISHEGYPVGYDPVLGLGILSTSSMRSGASQPTDTSSTHISRTSDYRGMTYLQSTVSFNTYIQRFKRFLEHLGSLPFSSRFRVTYDYDPERERRDDPRRLPVIVWQRPDYQPTEDPSSLSTQPVQIPPPPIIVPPSRPQPLTATLTTSTHHPVTAPPTFVQPTPLVIPYTAVTVVDDPTGFEAFNTPSQKPVSAAPTTTTTTTTTTGSSKRKRQWRASTPYRPAVPVPAPITTHAIATQTPSRGTPVDPHPPHQHQHYFYNRRRDGYVPAELAESHYGARYGPGIHSARAGVS